MRFKIVLLLLFSSILIPVIVNEAYAKCMVGDDECYGFPIVPPLNFQFQYFALPDITCPNQNHVLAERPNGKLACITDRMAEKTGWHIHYKNVVDFKGEVMVSPGAVSWISFEITGATLDKMKYENQRLVASVTPNNEYGVLSIELPRGSLPANFEYCNPNNENQFDTPFVMIIDGQKYPLDEGVNSRGQAAVNISLDKNSETIEIIRTCNESSKKPSIYSNSEKMGDVQDLEKIPKNEKALVPTGHTWDCASVSVEKLSSHDLETLQNIPNKNVSKFLKFTDDNLERSKILRTLVDAVNSRDYPLNERGYAELKVEEVIKIQHILLEELISKYGGSENDYSQDPDPIRYYDDDPNRWTQDKHRWEGYLTGFYSPTIIYQENLYDINGLGSSIRSHNLEEIINIQPLDITKEEYLEHDPERKFIEIMENEMYMLPGVKDAILQIGTWETSITEHQYTGDKIQQETMNYFREETQKQFPEFENGYVVDFTYGGNHYRTEYLVC